jgi:hypothetical protein
MNRHYPNPYRTNEEVIAVLTAISHVSARMAKNMTILANQRQSMKGDFYCEQNERYGNDHRGITQCSRCN